MPAWFIDIESATEIEAKSNATPPASRTPAQASRANSPSSALQGVTRPSVDATPTKGLARSSADSPSARRNARCGARSSPSTVMRDGSFLVILMAQPFYLGGNMFRALLALVLAGCGAAAWSQAYPSKTVRVVVPYAVGGSADVY